MGVSNNDANGNTSALSISTAAATASPGIWHVAKEGLYRVMSEAPKVWNGPNGQDYQDERSIIESNYKPFIWGMSSCVLCFANFRLAGSHFVKKITMRLGGQKQNATNITKQQQQWQSTLEREQERSKEKLTQAFSLPSDFAISLLIGASVSGLLFDMQKASADMETIPLVPGRSLVSDHLCSDITNAMNYTNKNDDTLSRHAAIQQDPSLETFRQFVQNCSIRHQHEDLIRKQHQWQHAHPVSIPRPGLSREKHQQEQEQEQEQEQDID